MKSRIVAVLVIVIGSLSWVTAASAQTFYLNPVPERQAKIGVRFVHPNFKYDFGNSPFSGTYDLSVNMPLTKSLNFIAAIPYSHVGFHLAYTDRTVTLITESPSEDALGNIYFGLQKHFDSTGIGQQVVSFGVYLPTARHTYPDLFPDSVILNNNMYDLQRILQQTATLYGKYALWRRTAIDPVGTIVGMEIGPEVFIPTADRGSRTTTMMLHYGVSLGLGTAHVAATGEILGLCNVTDHVRDFGDRFDHFLAVGGSVINHPIRPALFYHIPLDRQNRFVLQGVVGVKVEAVLR